MSKDRKVREWHADYDVNQRTYNDFQKYLSRFSSSDNPRLRLADFSQIKVAAQTLRMTLENVNKFSAEDAIFINGFRPGTKFVVEPNETDTALIAHVYAPFSKEKANHHKKNYDDDDVGERSAPNSLVPQGILFGYMLLVIVAVWKTTWNDWQFILRW